ncbi:MAG: hypothetical protein Q8K82_06740 [Gemmatimonadaceae bacterium]|nr:hypothetical protein [Gemmatimonadaceae bacterium]
MLFLAKRQGDELLSQITFATDRDRDTAQQRRLPKTARRHDQMMSRRLPRFEQSKLSQEVVKRDLPSHKRSEKFGLVWRVWIEQVEGHGDGGWLDGVT